MARLSPTFVVKLRRTDASLRGPNRTRVVVRRPGAARREATAWERTGAFAYAGGRPR